MANRDIDLVSIIASGERHPDERRNRKEHPAILDLVDGYTKFHDPDLCEYDGTRKDDEWDPLAWDTSS